MLKNQADKSYVYILQLFNISVCSIQTEIFIDQDIKNFANKHYQSRLLLKLSNPYVVIPKKIYGINGLQSEY